MTSVEYDLDTSGGLMPQIQALIAPPASEAAESKKKKERECRYRRPGRAVNHDCCDSCKEGGDLICCDRCPAAFHLQCHDPPLSDDDIPIGEWLCHKCKCTPLEEEDAASTSSSQSRQSSTKSSTKEKPEKVDGDADRSLSSGASSPVPMETEEDTATNPLQILIKAASVMNPQQFQLPNELVCTTQLPGSSKRLRPREGGRGGTKKLAHELDNGIVPLPAKLCFQCRRSCRKAPLIQCDYCPLLFHADCLDPPLTTLPTGRWMCPNHAEHILDEKLLSSVSLTERIKLYDKYTGYVNQDTVKIEFLKKVHRENPPFRYKKQLPPRKRVVVPNAIKEQYKNPPLLLPRITEPPPQMLPNKSVTTFASTPPMFSSSSAPTPDEQNEWLASVISFQMSVARFLAQKQLHTTKSESETKDSKPTLACTSPISSSSSPSQETKPAASQNFKGILCANTQTMNGPLSSSFISPTSNGVGSAVNGDAADVHELTKECSPLSPSPNKIKSECDEFVCNKSVPGCISRTTLSPVPPAQVRALQNNQNKTLATKPNNITLVTRVNRCISKANVTTNAYATPPLVNSVNSKLPSPIVVTSSVTMTTTSSTCSSSLSSSISSISTAQSSFRSTPILRPFASSCGITTQPSSGTPRIVTVHTISKTSTSSCSTTPTKVLTTSLSSSPAIQNLNNSLQTCIDGTGDVELSKLDERLIHILAWQRLQQLLPPKNPMPNQSTKKTPATPPANGIISPAGTVSTEVRARAVLCPLTGKGPQVPMPYRTLNIGSGADMEVCLTNFGHCNFISPKHACIFYDEITKHYELLNYSEHGTTVDNVLYSCDFSDKLVPPPPSNSIVASVRSIIDKKRNRPELPPQERLVMSSRAGESWKPCNCKTSSSSLIGGSGAGWEGTALLHHGSYIKCGCLQFVFSIAEYGSAKAENSAASERKSDIFTSLMHKSS